LAGLKINITIDYNFRSVSSKLLCNSQKIVIDDHRNHSEKQAAVISNLSAVSEINAGREEDRHEKSGAPRPQYLFTTTLSTCKPTVKHMQPISFQLLYANRTKSTSQQ
jgi:hypothetical protein